MHKRRRARFWAVMLPVVGLLAALQHLDSRLELEAEAGDEPHAATVKSFGTGGPEGLLRALLDVGRPPAEAQSVVDAVVARLGRRWKGSFILVCSTGGDFHHVTAFLGRRRATVGRGSRGVALAETVERLVRAEGLIGEDVSLSLGAAGVPDDLIGGFFDVFRWSLDFVADARQDDRFRAIWSERAAGGLPVWRRLEAAVYESGELGPYPALLWDGEFYDRKGRSVRRPFLRSPLRYRVISSAYGGLRYSPLGHPARRHRGTDFAAPPGTPIICVADGTVLYAARAGQYGNLVRVGHLNGRETFYGHLSRFGPGIREGAAAEQGQVLGYVGSTGRSTGPHLHFELRKDGFAEDYRAATLPLSPPARAARPHRFRARWEEIFD